MPAPSTAIAQEVIWKYSQVITFAVSLVQRALDRLAVGNAEFTTDIVPDAERGDGPGIPGSVINLLQYAHVIAPAGITQGGVFYPMRIKSTRPGAQARHIGVYRLASRELAEAFLRRNTNINQPSGGGGNATESRSAEPTAVPA